MEKRSGLVAVCAFLAAALLSGTTVLAQEPATPADSSDPAPAVPPPEEEKKKGGWIGLYVAVGAGLFDSDPVDTSIITTDNFVSEGTQTLDELAFTTASIGWKLREGNGDFRLTFNGYNESSYEVNVLGASQNLGLSSPLNPNCDAEDLAGISEVGQSPGYVLSPTTSRCLYAWWNVSIAGGNLTSTRTAPLWDMLTDDANDNNLADPGEIRFDTPVTWVNKPVAGDLQNQLQMVDFVYGREFGGRRFSSRWWAGMRYFAYEGNMLTTAWLDTTSINAGFGFTDGDVLRLLNVGQSSRGIGPTGSWEIDFNFFNKGWVIYLRGQAALVVNKVESKTEDFFTIVPSPTGALDVIFAPANLAEERSKTTWQNTAELGTRIRFRFGLEIEIAYRFNGFLDIFLLPTQISIPETSAQASNGTSALYKTLDLRTGGVYGQVGFQF